MWPKFHDTAVQQLRRHFSQGPAYDQFSRLLHLYATKTTLQGPTWGRRRQQQHANVGIMDHARILAFGNSHLRQAVFAWIAQHMSDDQVLRVTRVYHHYSVRVDFTNNTTIYVLANSYAPFSPQWQVAIQELMDNSTLSDFDAVVMGNVNACSTARLEDLLADHPELSCDYAKPEPQDWIRAFPGRILFMSSFMRRRRRRHQDGPLPETNTIGQDEQWVRIVLEARANGRDNVGFVYGRHYIETLRHEGATSEESHATADVNCPTCAAEGHSCVGQYGGFLDLAAWDLTEWLWTGMDSTNHSYTPRPFIQQLLLTYLK
jgi:hypothetical protein